MNIEREKQIRKNNREILLETVYSLNDKEILEVIDYCDRFICRRRKVGVPEHDYSAIIEMQEKGRGEFQAANHRKAGSI